MTLIHPREGAILFIKVIQYLLYLLLLHLLSSFPALSSLAILVEAEL